MARPDILSDSGRTRAIASSGLDAVSGAWGNGDLLNVAFDASGELALASATDVDGVILTSEGRKNPDYAGFKNVIGGRKYTVMTIADLVEIEDATAPTLAAGATVYATAAGDVTTSPEEGAIFIGTVLDSGGRMRLNVGGRVPAGLTGDLVSPAEIKTDAIDGGAAGNHTVTGISTDDTLVSVMRMRKTKMATAIIDGGAAGNLTVTGIAAADTLVSVVRLGEARLTVFLVAGGAAGDLTVTGIATVDRLVAVIAINGAGDAVLELLSEFTISGADTINNGGGTSTASHVVLVFYEDATDEAADLTSEFTIDSADTIDNGGGTVTTDDRLLVTWLDETSDELEDLTSEFSISATNTIENAGGTVTTGDKLQVIYVDQSA